MVVVFVFAFDIEQQIGQSRGPRCNIRSLGGCGFINCDGMGRCRSMRNAHSDPQQFEGPM